MGEVKKKMKKNKEVQEALQRRDIDDLRKSIADLKIDVNAGFKNMDFKIDGVHKRQDTTNGKVLKNEKSIDEIKAHAQYDKVVWYLFTVAVGFSVAMISYILFK